MQYETGTNSFSFKPEYTGCYQVLEIFFIRIFWFIVILLTLIAGIYAASPWLAEYGARIIAEAENVSIDAFEMDYPGSDSIHFDKLHFQSAGFGIVANNIDVSYAIADLAITHIRVAELTAQSKATGEFESANSARPSVDQLMTIIETVWQQMPAQSVLVDSFVFVPVDSGIEVTGELAIDQSLLTGTITKTTTPWAPDLEGELQLARNGMFSLKLHQTTNSGNRITLTAEISQQSFKHLLRLQEATFSVSSQGNGVWTPDQITLQLENNQVSLAGVLWGNPESSLQAANPDHLVNLTLNANTLTLTDGFVAEFNLVEARIEAQVNELQADLAFTKVHVQGEIDFAFANEALTGSSYVTALVTDLAHLEATLTPIPGGNFITAQSGTLVVNLIEPALISADIGSLTYETEATQLTVLFEQLGNEPYSIYLAKLKGTGDHSLDGKLSVHYPILDLTIPADVSWSSPLLHIDFEADHTLSNAPLAAFNNNDVMDVQAGRLHGNGTVSWNQGSNTLTAKLVAFADNVSGYYEDMLFFGLNGEFDIQYTDGAITLPSSTLIIDKLDSGFPLTNVTGRVLYDGQQITVQNFSVDAFDGTVTSPEINYDLISGNSQFELAARQMSLAKILALEGDQITGTGLLNGHIPILIGNNNLTVTDGQLSAEPPGGVIRYRDAREAAVSLEQQGFGFAIGALDNFEYKTLSAKVDYLDSGDLDLAIRLEGYNREVENGREIHYNLNISENIPALLRSLQLSDDITEQVERRVNR